LNRDGTDAANCSRDHYGIPWHEAHCPYSGVRGNPCDKQRTGHIPWAGRPRCQLIRRHCHVLGLAGPSQGEPDNLVAYVKATDARTEFGYHSRQVTALTRRKRRWK